MVTTPGTLPTPDGTGLVPDITPSDDPNNTSGPSPSSTAAGTRMYITGDGVNVRKEPSTSSEKITTLAKGTAVTAYELSGDFYQVKLSSGDIGYVSKNYLSTTSPANDPTPSASPTATPNTSNGKTMYVTGDSVNVRSTPSSSGSKLTSLKKGAQVTAYENKNGWYYIQYQSGKYGYISASYLTADAPSTATPTPTPTPTPTKPPTPSSWLDIGLP
ncbi:MAG: SH3 domain-containing protein [Lachnoclostridium sp.]